MKKISKAIFFLLLLFLLLLLWWRLVRLSHKAPPLIALTGPVATPGVQTLSIRVNPTAYNFGSLNVSTSAVSTQSILCTNDGNIKEDLSLKASSSARWTLKTSTPTGVDTFVIMGAFRPTRPSVASFRPDDILTRRNRVGAVGMDPFKILRLWFRVDTPTESSTQKPQTTQVTITVSPSR